MVNTIVRWPADLPSRLLAAAAVLVAAILLTSISGCSINVSDKDKKDGKATKVDIKTPVASLQVREEADPADVGLALYPGATRSADDGDDHSGAHVNIQSSKFGLKIVALGFKSDDDPGKIVGFYRKELARYGKVIECPNGIDMDIDKDKGGMAQEVHCQSSRRGNRDKDAVDLAVGSSERHRLVTVKPKGKGSKFALVYVQTRGERGTL